LRSGAASGLSQFFFCESMWLNFSLIAPNEVRIYKKKANKGLEETNKGLNKTNKCLNKTNKGLNKTNKGLNETNKGLN